MSLRARKARRYRRNNPEAVAANEALARLRTLDLREKLDRFTGAYGRYPGHLVGGIDIGFMFNPPKLPTFPSFDFETLERAMIASLLRNGRAPRIDVGVDLAEYTAISGYSPAVREAIFDRPDPPTLTSLGAGLLRTKR